MPGGEPGSEPDPNPTPTGNAWTIDTFPFDAGKWWKANPFEMGGWTKQQIEDWKTSQKQAAFDEFTRTNQNPNESVPGTQVRKQTATYSNSGPQQVWVGTSPSNPSGYEMRPANANLTWAPPQQIKDNKQFNELDTYLGW